MTGTILNDGVSGCSLPENGKFHEALNTKYNFHICTAHLAIIKVLYYQLMHNRIALIGIITFILKPLGYLSQ